MWASPQEIMGLVVTRVRRAGSMTGEADTRSDMSVALAGTGQRHEASFACFLLCLIQLISTMVLENETS